MEKIIISCKKIKIYGLKVSLEFIISRLTAKLIYETLMKSYSQKQEDLFLDKYFGKKKRGFYVDVGANDPRRFNNTKKFYDKGWHGINIEPDPKNFNKFVKDRLRDINLNIGVGLKKGHLRFYKFMPDTLSTFSRDRADKYVTLGYILESKINIEVKPLSQVFNEYCKKRRIDFLSIDTEGFDMQVLMSNDWNAFLPKLICIESIKDYSKPIGNKAVLSFGEFLNRVGYHKIYDNGLNSIFEASP